MVVGAQGNCMLLYAHRSLGEGLIRLNHPGQANNDEESQWQESILPRSLDDPRAQHHARFLTVYHADGAREAHF
jgi:hypothetical protein